MSVNPPYSSITRPGGAFRFFCLGLVFICLASLSGCVDVLSRPQVESPAPTTPSTQPSKVDDKAVARAQTEVWIRDLTGLSPAAQAGQAERVWRDPARPQMLRDRATFILATRPSSQSLAAQQHLANIYASAGHGERADMERLLTADLLTADAETLRVLSASVPRVQESQFPWNLTVWHAAQRNLLADSQGVLTRLADPTLYADPTLIGLQPVDASGQAGVPVLHSGSTALLLPLTGSFSTVGKQVATGAKVAAQALSRQGVKMDVRIIDTDGPGWQNQLAALPTDCVVVGGPLRADTYNAVKGSLSGRALFAFVPLLPDSAEEGTVAWRFFTSPQDQIDAVLDFSIGALGIYSYGVLAPSDAYGQRMTDYFLQAASMRGISTTTGTYAPDDMASWTSATGSFVGAVTTERGKIPVARASFEGIFLPDSWKSMDMLISSLHYHGAHKKVMMGTSIWEQGLANAAGLNTATYAQTIFPGVWNAAASNPAAQNLQSGMAQSGSHADDWAVLGYDFVQFAAALGLKSPVTNPADINAKIGAGLHIDWAGAPMTWDSFGKGHRRLFLFQPSRNGMVPLDRDAFISYRSGTGRLPNAESGEDTPASRYDPEMLAPDLDALVNSIVGPATRPAGQESSAQE